MLRYVHKLLIIFNTSKRFSKHLFTITTELYYSYTLNKDTNFNSIDTYTTVGKLVQMRSSRYTI